MFNQFGFKFGLLASTALSSGPAIWTPSRIASADLRGWWEGGTNYTYAPNEGTGTSHVQIWTDRAKGRQLDSGGGTVNNPFLQDGGAATYAKPDGSDFLAFDGVSDFLSDSSFTTPGNEITISFLFYIVDGGDNVGRIFAIGDKDVTDIFDPQGFVLRRSGTSAAVQAYVLGTAGAAHAVPYGEWTLATFWCDGTQAGFRLNGVDVDSPVAAPADFSLIERLRLFQRTTQSSDAQASGGFSDLVITSESANIETIEGFLAHSRGLGSLLPAGHFYVNGRPLADGSVEFTPFDPASLSGLIDVWEAQDEYFNFVSGTYFNQWRGKVHNQVMSTNSGTRPDAQYTAFGKRMVLFWSGTWLGSGHQIVGSEVAFGGVFRFNSANYGRFMAIGNSADPDDWTNNRSANLVHTTGGNISTVHNNNVSTPLAATGGQWFMALVNFVGGRREYWINGSKIDDDAIVPAFNTNRFRFFANGGGNGGNAAYGGMMDGILVDRGLTEEEVHKIFGMWAHRIGIQSYLPANHPYRNAQPPA